MAPKPLILVTGISGFVGSHVAISLLAAGYRVRGTARSAKAESLRTSLTPKYPGLEVVVLDDLTGPGVNDVLDGVGGIMHVASPLAGKEEPEQALKSAVEGTLNILRAAIKAGITNIVVTSSYGTCVDPDVKQVWQGVTLSEESWGQATAEEVIAGKLNPMEVYVACKILAEKATWELAAANPHVSISTINPPFIYGPLLEDFPTPPPTSLGSNGLLYLLIYGEGGRPLPTQYSPYAIDVRDVARAHIAALELPKGSVPKNKRFVISSGEFLWDEGIKHILQARPELKDRLPSTENPFVPPGKLSKIDTSFADKYLKMKYISWKDSLVDTLDSLLKAEKTWGM